MYKTTTQEALASTGYLPIAIYFSMELCYKAVLLAPSPLQPL